MLGFNPPRPPITCADGFTVSVQASAFHYCSPRSNDGPWDEVEVGFPSERPEPWESWESYAESPKDPTGTVYGYVPTELVDALIELHGGPAGEDDLELELDIVIAVLDAPEVKELN